MPASVPSVSRCTVVAVFTHEWHVTWRQLLQPAVRPAPSVTAMSEMLHGAAAFNQSVGAWYALSVTDMGYMFAANPVFNQDIGSWDVSSVTEMD